VKTVRITKADLIEALRSEPINHFQAGQWAFNDQGQSTRELGDERESCKVCAVGAIVRKVISSNNSVSAVCVISDSITAQAPIAYVSMDRMELFRDQLLADELYMNAISVMFESECYAARHPETLRKEMPNIIDRMISFIEERFPESFLWHPADHLPVKDDLVVI
jgi:hypothetical protein